VEVATKLLCKRYRNNRYIPTVNEWPPYHPQHYSPLTVIHHKGISTKSEIITMAEETSTKGNVAKEQYYSNIDFHNRAINSIADLFKGIELPFRMLIEGAPGIGKTVLTKEIAFQWANNDILSNKKILLLIFMRDPRVQSITSVKSFIKHFNLGKSLNDKVVKWLIETNGKYLTIVFDGFDEVSRPFENYFINDDLIGRKVLPECDLIITSRTATSANLQPIVEYRAEVLGFTESDRKDFIQKALQNQADELENFLKSNPIIDALCYIPLNMSILVCLAKEGIQELPKSETKLYHNFINMTICHFLRQDNSYKNLTISDPKNLPYPYDQAFKELSHFAFFALQKDQLVFTNEEVEESLPNTTPANWYKLGLLKSAQYFAPQHGSNYESCNFLHFSIQEYLAAYHIASLPDDSVLKLLRDTFWDVRYYNTWKMYVGITQGNQFSFQHFLSGNYLQVSSKLFGASNISHKILNDKIRCLHLLQCLEETDDNIFISLNKMFQDEIIDLSYCSLSSSDIRALAVLLLRSPKKRWRSLNLSHCEIDDSKCIVFCEILSLQNVPMNIESVDISYNIFHWESLSKLCTVFKNWNTKELILTINLLYDVMTANVMNTFVEKLNNSICSFAFSLPITLQEILLFSYIPEQKTMIVVLSSPSTIEGFQYHKCNLDDLMVTKLTDLVKEKHYGKKFGPCIAFSLGINKQCASILTSCRFKELVLRGSYPLSNGIFNVINELHSSTTAIIDYNWYSSWIKLAGDYLAAVLCHGIKSKSSFLSSMPEWNAKELINKINDLKPFYYPKKLIDYSTKNFSLFENSISEVANDIGIILKDTNLQDLTLNSNNLQTKGAIMVTITLINLRSLRVFDVSNNNIGSEAASYIANVLFHNTNLKILRLDRNNLQTEGVIKITEALQNTNSLRTFSIAHNKVDVRAADNIAAVLSHNNGLKQLYLGGNKLQETGVIKILRALKKNLSLTVLDIENNNVTDEAADDIAAVLSHNRNLKTLVLNGNNLKKVGAFKIAEALDSKNSLLALWDNIEFQELYLDGNNLQTEGISRIAKVLRFSSTITVLSLANNNVDDEAANDIATVLSCNTNLQELYLGNNNLHAEGAIKIASALKNTITLRVLSLCNNHISDEAADEIAVVISKNIKLELDIHQNKLQVPGAVKILNALLNNLNLAIFKMYYNKICITGKPNRCIETVVSHVIGLYIVKLNSPQLKTIAKELQNVSSLLQLSISNRSMATNDMKAILSSNTKIQKLHLNGNYFQAKDVNSIARALQNTSKLTVIDVSNNNISDEAADGIVAVLSHNAKLQQLYLGKNILQAPGAIKIAKALQKISTLTIFDISDNNISDEAADDIAAVLACNTNLHSLDVSVNDLKAPGTAKILNAFQNLSVLTEFHMSQDKITIVAGEKTIKLSICDVSSLIAFTISNYNTSCLHTLILDNIMQQTDEIIKIAEGLTNICSLRLLDISCNKINHQAANDIANILSKNTNLQELYLGGNNLQSPGAIIISRKLRNIVTLTHLNMCNNNINHDASDNIAAVLLKNTSLHTLILSDNNLQTTGASKITVGLQNTSSLRILNMCNNNIGCEAADSIATVLSHNTKLEELYLGENNLQDRGVIKIAEALQNISSLKAFDISNNNISCHVDDISHHILLKNADLQILLLNDNNLQTIGAIKIAVGLQNTSCLRILNMSNNNIGCEAADSIAAVLSHNTKLEELYLGENNLQFTGAIKIAEALQNISSLKVLSISNNNISCQVDDIACILLSNADLQILSLNDNNLQTTGAIKVAVGLQNTSCLRVLNMSNNNIGYEAADSIAAVLSHNTMLEELYLGDNNLKATGAIEIAQALRDATSLKTFNISNNDVNFKAADEISHILANNTKLQNLYLGGNNSQTAGVIKIRRDSQNTSTLLIFDMFNNIIGCEAANDIANILSNNAEIQLQIQGLDGNSSYSASVAGSLQNTSNLIALKINSDSIEITCNRNSIAGLLSYRFSIDLSLQAKHAVSIAKAIQNTASLQEFSITESNICCETAEVITTLLSRSTNLHTLNLSNSRFEKTSAVKIVKALHHTSLKAFWMSNNNISDGVMDDIAVILSHNVGLKELCITNNNLGIAAGIKTVARSLQNISSLTILNISNNNIGEEAAHHVVDLLSHNTELQELYLDRNDLHSTGAIEIARALQKNSALTIFSMCDNKITDKASDDIAAVLIHNTKLQKLYLGSNNFEALGTNKIVKGLYNTSTLTVFSMLQNNITDEAADNIVTILLHNAELQELNLEKNSLKFSGITKIVRTLNRISLLRLFENNIIITCKSSQSNRSMHNTNIKLSGNTLQGAGIIKILKNLHVSSLKAFYVWGSNINNETADDIGNILFHNSCLQKLYLGYNGLQTTNTIKILTALQNTMSLTVFAIEHNGLCSETSGEIATVLSLNTNLQELYLGGNNIQTTDTIKIAKALQNTSTLCVFSMFNNSINVEAANEIAAVLSSNTNLKELYLEDNNLQAYGAIKIAKALQNASMLIVFSMFNNNIGLEAADSVTAILSHHTELKTLWLNDDSHAMDTLNQIARAVRHVYTSTQALRVFNIDDNNISTDHNTVHILSDIQPQESYSNC